MTAKVWAGVVIALILYFIVTRGHMLMYFRFSMGEFIGVIAVALAGVYLLARNK